MKPHERKYLLDAFDWDPDTSFSLLHSGENTTYRVATMTAKYALRRYRRGSYTVEQVRGELAWVTMLRPFIHVPEIVNNLCGDSISTLSNATEEAHYVVFEFLDGDTILNPTESDYQQLGHVMRTLHDSTDHITEQATVDWEGWARPEYDLPRTIEKPLRCLLEFDVLTSEDKRRCVTIAQTLARRFEILGSSHHFIHADLHFGNILPTQNGWYCLDFDECGFGHRAIDIGVIRLHLQSLNPDERDKHWFSFKEGYGNTLGEEEARIGTALRIFYMAGKIPMRQDIEELRHNPGDRIRRYLGYIESEIRLNGNASSTCDE